MSQVISQPPVGLTIVVLSRVVVALMEQHGMAWVGPNRMVIQTYGDLRQSCLLALR